MLDSCFVDCCSIPDLLVEKWYCCLSLVILEVEVDLFDLVMVGLFVHYEVLLILLLVIAEVGGGGL